jgi:hypothetical protein
MTPPSVSMIRLHSISSGARVPVTAKLSRKFYERFGDDIAGELVDWFNAVDLTYQSQLKELNELNWERFKATLQGEIATLRADSRTDMSTLREELRTEMSTLREELRTEMSALSERLGREISGLRSELLKWMFLFWCVTMISMFGLRFFGPQ